MNSYRDEYLRAYALAGMVAPKPELIDFMVQDLEENLPPKAKEHAHKLFSYARMEKPIPSLAALNRAWKALKEELDEKERMERPKLHYQAEGITRAEQEDAMAEIWAAAAKLGMFRPLDDK